MICTVIERSAIPVPNAAARLLDWTVFEVVSFECYRSSQNPANYHQRMSPRQSKFTYDIGICHRIIIFAQRRRPKEYSTMRNALPTVCRFPLGVIDFEATSLDASSFPIEIGIAIARDAASTIAVWSTLIKPDPDWNIGAAWDPDAERIHGIRRGDLAAGIEAADVIHHANALLAEVATVCCGDAKYDPMWLVTLGRVGGSVTPSFDLVDAAGIVGPVGRAQLANQLATTNAPHRAGPDAERLCRAVIACWKANDRASTYDICRQM